jgi:hypothetical protein
VLSAELCRADANTAPTPECSARVNSRTAVPQHSATQHCVPCNKMTQLPIAVAATQCLHHGLASYTTVAQRGDVGTVPSCVNQTTNRCGTSATLRVWNIQTVRDDDPVRHDPLRAQASTVDKACTDNHDV